MAPRPNRSPEQVMISDTMTNERVNSSLRRRTRGGTDSMQAWQYA
jgi:hypothetical protein